MSCTLFLKFSCVHTCNSTKPSFLPSFELKIFTIYTVFYQFSSHNFALIMIMLYDDQALYVNDIATCSKVYHLWQSLSMRNVLLLLFILFTKVPISTLLKRYNILLIWHGT